MAEKELLELQRFIRGLGGISQEEAVAAALWLETNSHELEGLVDDQIGGEACLVLDAATGPREAVVPVVSLNTEGMAGIGNHRPAANGEEALLPWPGPDSVENTRRVRPVEDMVIDEE